MKNNLLSFYIPYYNSMDINELKKPIEQKKDKCSFKTVKQVESIFVQMLIKNMRDTLPKNELFDSDQSRLYTDVYDQKIAQEITKKGIGLTNIILQQINSNTITLN